MKRGSKVFKYVFSIAISFLCVLNVSNRVKAHEFVCLDRANNDSVCVDGVTNEDDIYYKLTRFDVDTQLTDLTIPSQYNSYDVEVIASNVINLTNGVTSLELNNLILPSFLSKIEDNAFNNILSIENVTIPNKVSYIGNNVFKETNITNLRFIHSSYEGNDISFDTNPFDKTRIDNAICSDQGMYAAYSSFPQTRDLALAFEVDYIFYTYENKLKTDVLIQKSFFVGKKKDGSSRSLTDNDIPVAASINGLSFVGWINTLGNTISSGYILSDQTADSVKVYPKYELNENLDFNLNSYKNENGVLTLITNENPIYNSNNKRIALKVSDVSHPLCGSDCSENGTDYSFTTKWSRDTNSTYSKVFYNLNQDMDVYIGSVSENGIYSCEITLSYTYEGITYTFSKIKTKTITIEKANLRIDASDISKVYGEELNDSDIVYSEVTLLGIDDVRSYTYIYKTGRVDAGTYYNDIQVKALSVKGSYGVENNTLPFILNGNKVEVRNSFEEYEINKFSIGGEIFELVSSRDGNTKYLPFSLEKVGTRLFVVSDSIFKRYEVVGNSFMIGDESFELDADRLPFILDNNIIRLTNDTTRTYEVDIFSIDNENFKLVDNEGVKELPFVVNGDRVEVINDNKEYIIKDNKIDIGDELYTNYNISYGMGNYVVTQKEVTITYNDNKEIAYTGQIYTIEKEYEMFDGTSILVYFGKSEPGYDVGEYAITRIIDCQGQGANNFNLRFDTNSSGKLIITKAKVRLETEISDFTFDNDIHAIKPYYLNANGFKVYLEGDLELFLDNSPYVAIKNGVSYPNYLFDSGSYTMVANYNSIKDTNYEFESFGNRKIVVVSKAIPNFIFPSSTQTYTYTGKIIHPVIEINNDEQNIEIVCSRNGYSNSSSCVDSGSYNVIASVATSKNYLGKEENLTLNINKYNIGIVPKVFNYYYNEEINPKEEYTINGEKIVIEYCLSLITSICSSEKPMVGEYNIAVKGVRYANNISSTHNNYTASVTTISGSKRIKILPRPIDIKFVNYDNLVYDGMSKSVGAYAYDFIDNKVLRNLQVQVKVNDSYDYVIKDAKDYKLRAYINDNNYVINNSNLLEFKVEKGNVDISNIKFDPVTYEFDFKSHSNSIKGILPEGIRVEYYIKDKVTNKTASPFKTTIEARFIVDNPNYNQIDSITSTIYIDMSWVIITILSIVIVIALIVASCYFYIIYRRKHPRKIKLKIKNIVKEDLETKRIAQSVKEAIGDEDKEEDKEEDERDLENDDSKMFIEEIYSSDSELKYYYSEVKNEILSYAGITHGLDKKYEAFYHGTRTIAKLSIVNNTLRLYINLDPDKYDYSQYNHENMSKFDCHAKTPLRIKVNSDESLRHARMFIRILRKKEKLKYVDDFVKVDYEKFYTLKENILPKMFNKLFSKKKKKGKE